MTEKLVVFANLGHALNVFPDDAQDVLRSACAPIDCEATAGMTFVTGGAKYPFAAGTVVRPYVAVGVGAARVSVTIAVAADGEDITDDVEDLVGALTSTSGLLEMGGGIDLPVGTNGKVDIGYRLMKIFEDDSETAHRFYGGFGWRF